MSLVFVFLIKPHKIFYETTRLSKATRKKLLVRVNIRMKLFLKCFCQDSYDHSKRNEWFSVIFFLIT